MKKTVLHVTIASSLVLSGCSLPGLSGPADSTIRIGTLDTVESEIWGYTIAHIIEHYTDLEAELITNLGSTIVQHQAMIQDEVDITATRYTGTDIAGVLDMAGITDPEEAMKIVQREFEEQFNQTWGESYGFENSYTVSIPAAFAEAEDITHVDDLEPFADEMNFGVDNSWVNRQGDGTKLLLKLTLHLGMFTQWQLGLSTKLLLLAIWMLC